MEISTLSQAAANIENASELRDQINAAVSGSMITVTDQVSYQRACELIANLQTMRKSIMKTFAEPKKKAAEAHKAVCELEKRFLEPVDRKIEEGKNATTQWYAAEQARIQAEEERRKKEALELAAMAAEAESAGDSDFAQEAVVAAAMEQAAVSVMPKCKGTSMREVWHAEVVDLALVPREYLIVNQSLLDKMAQASKGAIPIPGVKFVKSYINSTRAK